jgi:peptide/nickel transport system ATP-binding protein
MSAPFHPYTAALMQAVPKPLQRRTPGRAARDPAPVSVRTGQGCAYAGRCARKIGAICDASRPPWRETGQGLRIRCHLSLEELNANDTTEALQGAV